MTKPRPTDPSKKINKHQFIRLIAQDSGFTINDTTAFIKSLERVIGRCIVAEKVINAPGLFKIYVRRVDPFTAWDQVRKRYYEKGATKRIIFRASDSYRTLMEHYDEENEIDENEIEEENDSNESLNEI